MGITLSTAARNAIVDALVDLIDVGGAGTLQITSAGDTGFATPLATLTMSATAFGAASGGAASAASITSDTNTGAGTAALFRIKSGGGTEIFRGTVGTSGADIIFNTTTFTSGGICAINSLSVTEPAS